MRHLVLLLVLIPFLTYSQVSKDYAVMISVEVDENIPSITLKWPQANAGSYLLYKKLKSENNFPTTFELLPGSSTQYTDTAVEVGQSYEYHLKRNMSPTAIAYVNAGIKVDSEINNSGVKGRLILLVDSAVHDTLNSELDVLMDDLEGEGWTVVKMNVPSSFAPPDVKQLIKDEYDKDPEGSKAVFIIGNVAVPYSGNLVPDGHSNHVGAWPADCYYGDMNGTWTDNTVNNTSGSDPRTVNIPGDGKFDQSKIPTDLELQIGRVDLSNMPAFSEPESELLRAYLNKNHAFRTTQIVAEERALIDDNFGGFGGEAFAASGWKAFTAFFPEDSIYSNVSNSSDYRTDLNARSYLWSYGCGGGSYTSASGIGNTSNIAGDSLQSVFTMLFGSYFGDWDKQNNFLRAPLAQGWTLTNVWSGRPHWYFHHMALGDNIGYSFIQSINNRPNYSQSGLWKRSIHLALMGDPTLKMYYSAPPSNLQLLEAGNFVELTWTAAPGVDGYHVYRKDSLSGLYKKVNDALITGNTFTDTDFESNGDFYYTVRSVDLLENNSGSFYNVSGGVTGDITTIYTGLEKIERDEVLRVFPNPAKDNISIKYEGFQEGIYQFDIMNINGQILTSERMIFGEEGLIEMDVSHLEKGVYILSFRNGENLINKRLVVY